MTRQSASRLANLDLNLLVALRELVRERNVTRAAARIGISQPAASAALSRLRRHFDDDLLTRHGAGYRLTPLGAQLAEQVDAVCAAVERLFDTGSGFEPAAAGREFTLLVADYSVAVLGSALSGELARRAPGISLHLRLVREAFSADIGETIRLVDGMIAPQAARFDLPQLRSTELFADRWVCVLDAGHPAAGAPLTTELLASLPWVVAYQPDRGVAPSAPLLRLLATIGLEPTVRVRVESYLSVPHLVAGSDRVALVQHRLAEQVADRLGLVVRELPGDPAWVRERLWWHADLDADPANRWLRALLVELSQAL